MSVRKVFLAGLAFMLATTLPYLYGRRATPAGKTYLWTHSLNSGDLWVYCSTIARVRGGEILVRNANTVELPNRGMLRPTYLILGIAARLTRLPIIAIFHAGRILIGALFFVVFYLLAAAFLKSPRDQLVALVLAATSSGFGWLLEGIVPRQGCPDVWQTEANIFLSLFESPHFAAALLLISAAVLLLNRALDTNSLPYSAAAGGCLCLLLFEHPFDAIPMATVCALLVTAHLASTVAPRWRTLQLAAACAGIAAIAPILILLNVSSDPVAQAWAAQNQMLAPPPPAYLIGFGLLWPLTLRGAWQRRHSPFTWVLLFWALFGFMMISLPVPYQRRMAEGWQLPLVLLSAAGLSARSTLGSFVQPVMILLLAAGTAFAISTELSFYDSRHPNAYIAADLADAAHRMTSLAGPDDALLASPWFSGLTTSLTGVHVLVGNRTQNVVLADTQSRIEGGLAALSAPRDSAGRRDFLAFCASRRIRFLALDRGWNGDEMLHLGFGAVSVIRLEGLRTVFQNQVVTVFELPAKAP